MIDIHSISSEIYQKYISREARQCYLKYTFLILRHSDSTQKCYYFIFTAFSLINNILSYNIIYTCYMQYTLYIYMYIHTCKYIHTQRNMYIPKYNLSACIMLLTHVFSGLVNLVWTSQLVYSSLRLFPLLSTLLNCI